jgi:hypothetical protein
MRATNQTRAMRDDKDHGATAASRCPRAFVHVQFEINSFPGLPRRTGRR